MKKVKEVKYRGETHILFRCPGCNMDHIIPITGKKAWGFNGNLESPTLTPSIVYRFEWSKADQLEDRHADEICHSYVTNGFIEFLSDCTHELRGKIVPLETVTDG